MFSSMRSGGIHALKRLAMAFGIVAFWSAQASAEGCDHKAAGESEGKVHQGCAVSEHGVNAGIQGFGLKYHLGYGYGGRALGVGPFGGYPFYGGPGYPHDAPAHKRFCGAPAFPYYGGPGYSYHGHPNFYEDPGQLVVNEPVAQENVSGTSGDGAGSRADSIVTGDYGIFTGMVPYPESFFAPYSAAAASGASSGGESSSNRPTNAALIATASDFGIDEEPIVDSDGVRAIKVSNVHPGMPAERAALKAGDVIRSVNGFRTERHGNLAWIIANATPRSDLTLYVRKLSDGRVRAVTARFP
jgi:hypothetical protein